MSVPPDTREISRLGALAGAGVAALPALPAPLPRSGAVAHAVLKSADGARRLGGALHRGLRPDDRVSKAVARFQSVSAGLRWGALAVGFAMALVQRPTLAVWVSGGALAAVALVRTVSPTPYGGGGLRVGGSLLLEVSIGAAAVEFTGLEHSPFLLCLAVATLVAGHAGGRRIVPGLVALACLSIVVPSFALVQDRANATDGLQFATLLLLVGLVGSYSRHLLDDADRLGEGAMDHMEQLSEVNELLLDLHAASERVPMPLELQGAVGWILERAEEAFSPDLSAVILRDHLSGAWRVAVAKGLRAGPDEDIELMSVLAAAARGEVPQVLGPRDHGLDYTSKWGLYAPLRARHETIGLLVLESKTPRPSAPADERRLSGLASAAALVVDNARWLERIHTFGVEQERFRLARELHDHLGQSMMYLGIELDRLVKANRGRAVAEELLTLRKDLRGLVEELRDTLVDLRSDVSEERDLVSLLEALADRVNRRGRLKVVSSFEVARRLALPVEREVWRIAQEAVINAERHARASEVSVLWLCHQRWAMLEVTDNGVGLPAGALAKPGSYGLMGMRERADAVGGELDIGSQVGKGTTVTMRLKVS